MRAAILTISVVIAFFLGTLVRNIPAITVGTTVPLIDVLQLIATISIAVLVPLTIGRAIARSNSVKEILLTDMKEVIRLSKGLRSLIYSTRGRPLQTAERQELLFKFTDLSRQVGAVRTILENAYNRRSRHLRNELENAFLRFKSEVTGGNLFTSEYTVTDDYLKGFEASFDRYSTESKVCVHKIQKL